MIVSEIISEIRHKRWEDKSASWGLVPTMGSLHEGHLSLVRQAREENNRVAASIFVNPIQFNRKNDYDSYPTNLASDLELLEREGVDLVWTPQKSLVYPEIFQTYIDVTQLSKVLEGAARPGHFQGVTTIVAILFNVFQPTRAYFGQKDAQQEAVIRRMVEDLHFNIEIRSCPTVREKDGLAMSSRNANLTKKARAAAPVLFRALNLAKVAIEKGEISSKNIYQLLKNEIEKSECAQIDYISIADQKTLNEIKIIAGNVLISLAVFWDEVRLIDNIRISNK
ncbi:MAG: pantoate--beta-alanine ligase [Calditrichaeota bacterium]|nr:MAG: pantoate--beta-alanine ligase [Calditrichota bacterium]